MRNYNPIVNTKVIARMVLYFKDDWTDSEEMLCDYIQRNTGVSYGKWRSLVREARNYINLLDQFDCLEDTDNEFWPKYIYTYQYNIPASLLLFLADYYDYSIDELIRRVPINPLYKNGGNDYE